MPTFNNLNEMFSFLQKQANKSLKNEVAETVQEEMSRVIKDVEYPLYVSDAREPYQRHGDDGGLSDIRNMQVEIIDDNTISIESVRMDGTRDVSQIFAEGIGYSWKNSKIYGMQPFPRNFYNDTVEELKTNGKHLQAFKAGMERLGIKMN